MPKLLFPVPKLDRCVVAMSGALQQGVDLRSSGVVMVRAIRKVPRHNYLSASLWVHNPMEILAVAFPFHEHPKRSQQPHRGVLLWPLVLAESIEGRLPDSFQVSRPCPGDQRCVRRETRYRDVEMVDRMKKLV